MLPSIRKLSIALFALIVVAFAYLIAPIAFGCVTDVSAASLNQTAPQNLQFMDSLGGQATDIVVNGNYAYTIVGIQLVVLDISNPVTPKEVSRMALNDFVEDLVIVNDYLYLAVHSGLTIISISDPLYPVKVGSFNISQNSRSIAVQGHYAYLLRHNPDYTESLVIVDVSKPASPIEVSSYTSPVYRYGLSSLITVQGNYAYMSGHTKDDLLIVNISDPLNPQFVSYLDALASFVFTSDLTVIGGIAYVTYWNFPGATLEAIDISNPFELKRSIISSSSQGPYEDIAAIGPYIYWGSGKSGPGKDIQVINVADSAHPFVEKVLAIGSASFVKVENRLYSASRNYGLHIFDLSVPLTPTLLNADGTISGDLTEILTRGNFLYATGSNALQIFDLSKSKNVIGSLAINGKLLALDNNKAYLSWVSLNTESGDCYGFHAVDITNPFSPTLTLTHQLGCSNNWQAPIYIQAIADDHLYVRNNEEVLFKFDLATPFTPTLLGTYAPAGRTMIGAQNHAYVADWLQGITILDISEPTALTLVNTYSTIDAVYQFAVADHYLLAVTSNELHILDISNPTQLVEVGKIFLANGASSFGTDGDYIYIVDPVFGVRVFDITNPTQPSEIANYPNMPGQAFNQVVVRPDQKLYVSSGTDGLFVLQLLGRISGKVVDSFGKPHAGVKVTLSDGQSTQTNAQGDYSFTSLPPGSYTVKVESPTYDFQPSERTLRAPSYSSNAINFTLLLKPLSTTVTSDAPTHLSYTDLLSNVLEFDMPAGVVTQTTALSVLPQAFAAAPGQFFTGVRFDLQTGEANSASSNFTFTAPLTITIHYTASAVAPVTDRNQLLLRWWDGSQWVDATTPCSSATPTLHDLESQVLTTTVCQSGQFALFGPTIQHFLPLVSLSQVATSEMRGRFVAQHSGKCLNVLAESQQNRGSIIQWPCVGGDNEIWSVRQQGEYAQIVAKHSQKCLNVSDASQAEGAQVIQYSCSGGDNELWRLLPVDDNLYQIVAKHSNQCLTVQDASQEDKAQVIQRNCSESPNQIWRFQAFN